MFDFSNRRLFLASQPVDMRKSFDTLASYVSNQFHQNPYSGDAFLFIGKRKNRLKILIWEDSGFWIFSKRLEVGTFSIPKPSQQTPQVFLTPTEFRLLLDGIVVLKAKRLKRYPGLQKK